MNMVSLHGMGGRSLPGSGRKISTGALGLAFIPPELRENSGEIEAAEKGRLPHLIGYGDLKGDLHVHTRWSDGAHTIREMAEAAREQKYEYIAICDHSAGLAIAHGMTDDKIHKQAKEVAELNLEMDGITILHGIEANIDRDGNLDVRKDVLAGLDFVVAGVHSGFRQPEKKMTERLLTAIHHDHLDMVSHPPTGRLLQRREPYQFNMDSIFEAAAAAHVLMEINAFPPTRLDLSDIHSRRARTYGVVMGIGTDAPPTKPNISNILIWASRWPAGDGWRREMCSIPGRLRGGLGRGWNGESSLKSVG